MKKIYVGVLVVLTLPMFAQIGVGTTTPNTSSILDVSSSNRGFLLPRVALTSLTDVVTVPNPAKGLLVYNKGTGGLTQEGIFVWNELSWKPFVYDSVNEFNGDVSGNVAVNKVVGIQRKPILFSYPTISQLLRYNGTAWVNSNDVSSQNWLMRGNNTTQSSCFLGTTDDSKMTLSSYNQPFFEFGRRQTLGLTQGYTDYTDDSQLVTHLRSAIQFEAIGSVAYKPIFFVNNDGNFRFKGSMAGDDYFEIGAAGSMSNDGSVEFIVGDEGNEPIVFEKFNNATSVEMLRLQGTGSNTDVRIGMNTNAVVANSVLQVNGSISKSIVSTSTNLTLTDAHYTVVLTGGATTVGITLPLASSATGRVYIIRNTSGSTKTISNYTNESGTSVSVLNNNSVVWLQSDGTNWLSM
ncbi:hypothetical protein [Flavobacterium sp. GCM10027622]|uniref:hypothetical protein n=1 Tax=unclassified Flavobacterium TaxID=196869 RepID=UPI0036087F65